MSGRESIVSVNSKLNQNIVKKLVDLGFITSFEISGDKLKKIKIVLLYRQGAPAITDVKIYSRPGRRYYVSYSKLKSVLGGMGYSILTTPSGVLTGKEARAKKVGGELLFNIW